MTSWWRELVASTRVLFWKNVRVKQRQAQWRRPSSGLGTPFLLFEVVLPLCAVLVVVKILCDINTRPHHDPSDRSDSTHAVALTITALSRLLPLTNSTVVTLDRPDNHAFLAYLDATTPRDDALGFLPIQSIAQVVPFKDTHNASEADRVLETHVSLLRRDGVNIYAAWDIRRALSETNDSSDVWDFRVWLNEDDARSSSSDDQVKQYLSLKYHDNVLDRIVKYPGILALQVVFNRFQRSRAYNSNETISDTISAAGDTDECGILNQLLLEASLDWDDLKQPSTVGNGLSECKKAVQSGLVNRSTLSFLHRLEALAGSDSANGDLRARALPRPQGTKISGDMEDYIVVTLASMFVWPFTRLVRDVVMEKEGYLKEYLLIMGLGRAALSLSWFLLYAVAVSFVGIFAVAALSGSLFAFTIPGAVLFLMLVLLFAISVLALGIAVSAVFNDANAATGGAPLIYTLLGVAAFLRDVLGEEEVDHKFLHYFVWTLKRVSSPAVFVNTVRKIAMLDATTGNLREIQWVTISGPVVALLLQTVLYAIIGSCSEHIFSASDDYFTRKSSTGGESRPASVEVDATARDDIVDVGARYDIEHPLVDDTLREMPLSEYVQHVHPILLVKSLSKRYPNGKLAVKNVSFGVKKGEIFGLLGPNGAGKSTTMSMLSGMLSPSEGDAFVGSKSVVSDARAIRKSLSVCFQQNVLFDDLTVWEHLKLVYELKTSLGVPAVEEDMWVHKLRQFGLEEKRDALAKTLSEGGKRRLSLVLALMGKSDVVLLDEPTTGIDIEHREELWTAMKTAVRNRAVVLTTQSMEEAQVLCENVGILCEGRLKCCGSTSFLQMAFGCGYKISIRHARSKLERLRSEVERERLSQDLLGIIRRTVESATMGSSDTWATQIQLNDSKPDKLVTLVEQLDSLKATGMIDQYQVFEANLEDVFTKVTHGNVHHQTYRDEKLRSRPNKVVTQNREALPLPLTATKTDATLSDREVFGAQVRALFWKSWMLRNRRWSLLMAQFFWPIFYFALFPLIDSRIDGEITGLVEDITELPPTFYDSRLLLASLPSVSDSSVEAMLRQLHAEQRRIIWEKVESEGDMLATVAQSNLSASFFGAVLVSNTPVSAVARDQERLVFSFYYSSRIPHSLPVASRWISEAMCSIDSSSRDKLCQSRVRMSAIPGEDTTREADVAEDVFQLDSLDPATMDGRISQGYNILWTMMSIVSLFVATTVEEQELGQKRLLYQHMASPFSSSAYWLTKLTVDCFELFIAQTIMGILMYLLELQWNTKAMTALVVCSFAFGLAMLMFSYATAAVFSSSSSAQTFMTSISWFQMVGVTIIFALTLEPDVCVVSESTVLVLDVLPLFAYGRAVLFLASMNEAGSRQRCLTGMNEAMAHRPSPWDWNVAGRPLTYLLGSTIMYSVVLWWLDSTSTQPDTVWGRCRSRTRLAHRSSPTNQQGSEAITINSVTKMFLNTSGDSSISMPLPPDQTTPRFSNGILALDSVSFSVPKRDVVALLGVNGSGKSTTFEVLTSGIAPTSGSAQIDGVDVTTEPHEASRRYGYCPQTNIVFNELTVREHLELFYRLRSRRSYSKREESETIDALLRRLDLFQVETTAASHLSGGNKRRLMLALALLHDDVPVLLMDEPSAGVDVVARRLMWKVLHDRRQSKRDVSCLFTTHSMEEAEAVCANAVVLSKGKVVWSGSIPELKQHASRGISISLRLDTTSIWDPERVRYYVDKIRWMLSQQRESSSASSSDNSSARSMMVSEGRIPGDELERAWELCRQHYPRSRSRDDPTRPSPQGQRWITSVLSRLESEARGADASASVASTTPATSSGSSKPTTDLSALSMDMSEFVKEWLVRETFNTIESQLFEDEISARSGEEVRAVDLQNALGSGSNTTAVYETTCTSRFGLVDAFKVLETHKTTFSIARYSISELSLERVFEQLLRAEEQENL